MTDPHGGGPARPRMCRSSSRHPAAWTRTPATSPPSGPAATARTG